MRGGPDQPIQSLDVVQLGPIHKQLLLATGSISALIDVYKPLGG